MNNIIRCVVCLSLLFIPFSAALATVDDLAVVDYQLMQKKRADQFFFEYTFTVTVNNTGTPLNNVVATLTSGARTTIVMDDTVVLGDIESGAVQSIDSFTFRQDRRVVFDPDRLFWSFTADGPPLNTAPTANAGPDQSASVGSLITLDGSGSEDSDMDALTYAWSLVVPTGSTAILTGETGIAPTFTADVAGEFVATLIVNDGTEDSTPDSVTITATVSGSNPPSIVSSPITGGSVNEGYIYDVDATDVDTGDVLTYTLMQAPAGMSIDAQSGVINWLPAVTGPADVDVIVTDLTGLTDRQIFLILINNGAGDQPPTLAPIEEQGTVVGQAVVLTAMGNDPEGETLRYGLVSAPPGMSINTATGELAWTPGLDQYGSFSATVSVSDPGGQSAMQSFNTAVLAQTPNMPPAIDPVADRVVDPFESVQIVLTASDDDVGDILLFSLSGAPAGLQFDPRSGAINWLPGPADAGTVGLTATVTDSVGDSDSTLFSITVNELPEPPVAVDDAYAIDRDLMLDVAAPGVLGNDTDPNNDVLSAATTTLPAAGTLDAFPGDGSFVYTPPQNPDITIGLRERCRSPQQHAGSTVIVGDIDHDGATELIGYYYGGFTSYVYVMNGADCTLKQPVLALGYTTYGVFTQQTTMALANLDADADLELILVRAGPPELGINRARLVALNFDGSFVWSLPQGASEAISLPAPGGVNYYQNRGPTLADLNGDGSPEILMPLAYDPGVFDFLGGIVAYNTDGTILWEFAGVEQGGSSFGKPLYVADLDLDGTLEVIYHTNVVDHNGNLEFTLQSLAGSNFHPQQLTVAIANFDNDPFPEIIARDTENLYLFEHTPGPATWVIPYPNTARGEITVGDFDGDGSPEFAFHSGLGSGTNASWMIAFDTDGSVMWSHQSTPYDSIAGTIGWASTAFDYDQDGKDELTTYTRTNGAGDGIFIFDGADGTEIASFTGGGSPLYVAGGFSMFPTIADVDNDGAAEIAFAATSGLGIGPLLILEGLEGNPLPPARPIRNQRIYQPTHVNPDGSVPAYPRPHWLIPGLNMFHGAAVIPFEDPGTTDSYRYTASDATATSNEATVTIAVTNANAPVIVSRPALGASPGFDYLYGLLATDADFGDVFTYTLVDAPTGMTLDSFGLVTWTPNAGDLGSHRVHIVVTDSQGNTDEQSYQIDVVPPVIMPDIIGNDLAEASDTLTSAGLAVGSVTQAYSLTVPAGEVISQSLVAGAESAAGAFINFVVSLGPQPIFVPMLADVSAPVAQGLLESVALVLGSVTGANSDTVPAGLVLSQSIAANTEVERDTVIDITVSSGPAVLLELDRPLVAAGEILPIVVTVFDNEGMPLSPQPAVILSVEFEAGTITGTLPVASISDVATSIDTSGPFTLVADAGAFGTVQAPFIVRRGLPAGGYYEPIALFMETITESQRVYTELVNALTNNDLAMIASLGAELVALRDAIDLENLADRTPFAHETGFIPSASEAASAGFPAGFGELDQLPSLYAGLETALTENRAFLERLDPAVARDDDVRARALNNKLKAKANQFLAINTSVGGRVFFKTHSYVLLSRSIPALVVADLNASINALADSRLLNRMPDKLIDKPLHGNRRSQIFTLGGLMAGSSVRMTLIKNLYVPHISRLIAAGHLLAEADALREDSAVGELAGIITGASLSLHVFNAPNSVIEVVGPSADTRAFSVKLIGPDKYQAWLDAVAEATIPTSLDEFEELITAAADAAAGSLAGTQTAQAHGVIPGCLLSLNPDCSQIVIGYGFPVTHTSGVFPSPVIVILKDIADSKLYVGVYAFFPN